MRDLYFDCTTGDGSRLNIDTGHPVFIAIERGERSQGVVLTNADAIQMRDALIERFPLAPLCEPRLSDVAPYPLHAQQPATLEMRH